MSVHESAWVTARRLRRTEFSDFLTARLEEDQAIAEASLAKAQGDGYGSFVARIICEIDAKRAVMKLHSPVDQYDDSCRTCSDSLWPAAADGATYVDSPCPTLLALASVYHLHVDFKPEWAVQ